MAFATEFRYLVEDEERPKELFYHESIQYTLLQGHQLAEGIMNCLSSSEVSKRGTTSLQAQCEIAKRLSTFSCSRPRLIGVLGNSGEGKSFGHQHPWKNKRDGLSPLGPIERFKSLNNRFQFQFLAPVSTLPFLSLCSRMLTSARQK